MLHVLKNALNTFYFSDVTISCIESMMQVQSIKFGFLDSIAEDNVVNEPITPTLPLTACFEEHI